MLNLIKNSASLVLCSMKDFLDQGLIENGMFSQHITNFNYHEAVADVVGMMELQAFERSIQISTNFDHGTPKFIKADKPRLQQVLLNLISNAVKFTPSEGKIRVTCSFFRQGDSYLLKVKVKDNGPGICESDIQLLFKPFSKLPATAILNPNGNGLGLYVCKRICEQLGGEIWVKSGIGSGAIFSFTMKATEGTKIEPVKELKQERKNEKLIKQELKSKAAGKIGLAGDFDQDQNDIHV